MANTRGIRAGRAFVELGVSDKLTAALRRAEARLKAFGASVQSIGLKMAALGGAVLAPFAGAVKQFSAYGDTLDKMSIRTGVAVESLSEMKHAVELSGSSLQTFEKGIKKMQMTINDAGRGLSTAVDGLDAIGISFEQLQGMSPEDQFKAIAEGISRIEDPSKRAAVAQLILGRAGTELLPLMQDGARGIEELQKAARDLGLTVSTETAKDAALLNDTLGTLFAVIKNGVFVVGSALSPSVIKLAASVTKVVVGVVDWIKANKAAVVWVARVAAITLAAGLAIAVLGTGIVFAGAVLGGLATIITSVSAAFGLVAAAIGALLSPIGLVATAIVGLGTYMLISSGVAGKAIDWLMDRFGELRAFVGKVAGGIADALAAGDIQLAAEVLWAGLKVAWQTGVGELNKIWLGAKEFVVGTAYKIWYGVLAAAEIAWHGIEVGVIETVAFLSKAWTRFATGFKSIWEQATTFVAKRMLEIQGVFDDSLDVGAAKESLDQQLKSRLDQLDAEKQAALAAKEQERKSARERSKEQSDATLGVIGQQFEDAQKELRDATDAKIQQSQAELDAAKKKLDESIEAARAAREAAGPDAGPARSLAGTIEGLFDDLAGELGSKLEIRGTFNASAVQSLRGGGANAADRTADVAEKIERHTKRLVDALRTNKLVFAGE